MGSESNEHLTRSVAEASDLAPIRAIAAPLLGQMCWMVDFGYPSVLNLHWGRAVRFATPLGEREQGEWILHAFGSEWTITCAGGTQVRSTDPDDEARARATILEGASTARFDVLFPDLELQVGFDNGCVLRLSPERDDLEARQGEREGLGEDMTDMEVEDWALFCPDDMYLRFGPGPKWWYGPRLRAP